MTTGTRRVSTFVVVAGVVWLGFFGSIGVSSRVVADALDANGVTAQARVVGVEPSRHSKKILVAFAVPEHGEVTAWCDSCSDDLAEGDRVDIRYNPGDLDSRVEQLGWSSHRNVANFSLFIMVPLSVGLLLVWAWRVWKGRRSDQASPR